MITNQCIFMNMINLKKRWYQNPAHILNPKIWFFFKLKCVCVTKTQCIFSIKKLENIFNSMNAFLISLVISFLGSQFKILRMSWYKSMKLFWDNLVLVINKYLWSLNHSFPGSDSISNEQVLSGTSKYNSSHNWISIFIWIVYLFLY